MSISSAFLALGKWARRGTSFPRSGPAWEILGWLGFLFSLYLLTFPAIVDDSLDWAHPTEAARVFTASLYAWTAFAMGVVAWVPRGIEIARLREGRWRAATDRPEEWLVPLTVLWVHGVAVGGISTVGWTVAGVFNLVLLALAATWMGRGCRLGLVGPTVLGSLLLVALTGARYFDLFESLLARGAVFLLVGAVLFAEGLLFARARRTKKAGGGP